MILTRQHNMSYSELQASLLSRRVPPARVAPLAMHATPGGERPEAPDSLIVKGRRCCARPRSALSKLAAGVLQRRFGALPRTRTARLNTIYYVAGLIKPLLQKTLLFAALCLLAAGAAQGAAERSSAKVAEQPARKAELVWPPPPLAPRIRYLHSIATSDDIRGKKGFWRKFWEFFRGPQVDAMIKPMGVVADRKGRVYVADPAARRVHVFDKEKRKYRFIDEVDKQFLQFPINVALDDKDNLYIVDGVRKRVFALTNAGKLKRSYGEQGQLQRPSSAAVDTEREMLYVVDPPSHDIKVFGLADGKLKRVIGKRGVGPGEFNFPAWLALDREGRLYVTDSLNGRIQILSPEGKPLSAVGRFGDGSGNFSSPKGVALDSEEHLYVTDSGFDNIQIFDNSGRLLLYFGTSGQVPGSFWMPAGIFIDHHDKIYVADAYNRRVQVYQYLKKKASP